jgi:hypothetical protein
MLLHALKYFTFSDPAFNCNKTVSSIPSIKPSYLAIGIKEQYYFTLLGIFQHLLPQNIQLLVHTLEM